MSDLVLVIFLNNNRKLKTDFGSSEAVSGLTVTSACSSSFGRAALSSANCHCDCSQIKWYQE